MTSYNCCIAFEVLSILYNSMLDSLKYKWYSPKQQLSACFSATSEGKELKILGL